MAIISPIQDGAMFDLNWIRVKPRITQKFGDDFTLNGKWVYKEMGMKGHNGIDIGIPTGTKIYAPFDGIARFKDDGINGYGMHIRIRSAEKTLDCVLGHLSRVAIVQDQKVHTGDLIGYSGNTGFSTASHLHMGLRMIKQSQRDIWNWKILDYKNGYFGYFDHSDLTLCWKGTFNKNSL